MAKQLPSDADRVRALLDAVRDGAPPVAADAAAVAWLRGQGTIDALDAEAGLAAVAAALELGLAERVVAAGAARAKEVRKAARAAAHKLRSAGVSVPEAGTGTTWSIGREDRALPEPRALIGLPEEDGYLPFLLASYGEEQSCLSGGAAGPGQGFRDDEHGHASRSQTRKILDDALGTHRLHELGFYEAVAMLERAFDLGGGRRPAGWSHLVAHADAETLRAARALDPFRALATELDVDALHRPDPLLVGRWAVSYAGQSERMSGFLQQAIEALTGDQATDLEGRRARVEQVVDEAATSSLDGPQRGTWAFGMNVVALLASRAGDEEAARVARATALALDEGRPGQDIPWARELINRQLSWVSELLLSGGAEQALAEEREGRGAGSEDGGEGGGEDRAG